MKKQPRPVIATWWHASSLYRVAVEKVKVVAFTASTVTILDSCGQERRHDRSTMYSSYFPAFDAARAFYLDLAKQRLEKARRDLDAARGMYGNAMGLTEESVQ